MVRYPLRAADVAAWQPAPEMNTTPLIDLMLVLLVMFIVSVPVATHKVPLELPGGPPVERESVAHRLAFDAAGALFWDGQAVSDADLRARLVRMAADPADPELHIAADGETPYGRVDEVLATVARAGISRMGFVGNERFAAMLDQPPSSGARSE